jgi:hypothetical protein
MPGLMGPISVLVRAKISKLPDRQKIRRRPLTTPTSIQLENHQKLGPGAAATPSS